MSHPYIGQPLSVSRARPVKEPGDAAFASAPP